MTTPNASSTPSISDAEWQVMREFWSREEATSAEIIDVLVRVQDWKPPTVQTMISRLVKKGALAFRRNGREYIYWASVAESDCVHEASRTFVDRVFGGKLAPMLSSFLEREKLSKAEIEELKKLLEEGASS